MIDNLTMLNDILFRGAERHPGVPALGYYDEESYSYGSAAEQIDRLAAKLRADGLCDGGRIAILSQNMPHWGIAYMAINRAGGVVVPVLPDFIPEDIGTILGHAEIDGIFVSRRMLPKLIESGITDSKVKVYLLDNLSLMSDVSSSAAEAALQEAPRPNLPEGSYKHPGGYEDLAVIIYTSGTTGHSKGVMLSNKNILFDVVKTSPIPGIQIGDALLSILPLAHTYECTIAFLIPLYKGASISYIKRPPSTTVLLPALKQVRPQIMLSVPLLIEKIYRQSVLPNIKKKALLRRLYGTALGRKLLNRAAGKKLKRLFGGRLYFFGIGGAALAPEVEDFLIEARFPYCIGYGLTETSPLIAGDNAHGQRPRSTGMPIEGIEVRIDQPNPETGEGEIIVKGPIVMMGYYKDPERTAEVIDPEGWFHTGDLGIFDEDGRLYIKGRKKNMILGPSGENIYPEAIESLINSYDFVEDSLVFQHQGELMARVQINYDGLKEHMHNIADSASDVPREIGELLNDIRKNVNRSLSSFSRIGKVIEQKEPFEKTPTKKIKRFLYDSLHKLDPRSGKDKNRENKDVE